MTVFFMHIPKTAGTSFRGFLVAGVESRGGRAAPVDALYPDYDRFAQCGRARAARYDLVCGHYPYHLRELFPPDSTVVTVLRDPLERCLSHIKHQIAHERRTGTGSGAREPDEFIAHPHNRWFLASIANLIVKYLCFRGHPNTLVEDDALDLDRALAHARACRLGFSDELGAFERRLSDEWLGGRSDPLPVAEVNRSPDRSGPEDLSPTSLERLRRLNDLDLRLHATLKVRSSSEVRRFTD